MASAAIRYAKAVVDVALAKNAANAVSDDLHHFSGLLSESRELIQVLTNPAVSTQGKKKIIAAISRRAGYSSLMHNFLCILADHHRFNIYSEILAAVQRELDGRLGLAAVRVTSAAPLTDPQKGTLADRLRAYTRKEVRLEFQTDAQLIGGLMAQIGSTIYDGSIREQLQQARRWLSGD
jgi:F-type H+-transporting ATPase subunit delta